MKKEVYGAAPPMEADTEWEILEEKEVPGLGRRQKFGVILRSGVKEFRFPLIRWLSTGHGAKSPVALYIESKPRVPADMGALIKNADSGLLAALMGEQAEQMKAMLKNAPAPKPCDIETRTVQPYWLVEDILRRGIATAAFYTEDIAEDRETDFENGLFGFFGGRQARGRIGWGAIAAWAYGAQ